MKLRLPIYMKFSETPSGNAEGDTTRTLAGLQRLSVFDASKDITDNETPPRAISLLYITASGTI